MRGTPAWAFLGAFGFCLGVVSLPQALAQQPQDAPAVSAKGEQGSLGAEIRDLTDQSVKSGTSSCICPTLPPSFPS